MFGSPGFDYASFSGSDEAVNISLGSSVYTGGHAEGDQLYSIEGLIGSAFADLLLGDDQRNVFRGGGSADQFLGQSGMTRSTAKAGSNDWLDGGAGSDLLAGSGGDDELRGGAGTTPQPSARRRGGGQPQRRHCHWGESNDRLFGIENLAGTSGADLLIGNGGVNV